MANSLAALRDDLKDCQGCRLCEQRNNVVFGAGPADARVMLIGEGPGQNEDETGEPFVGRGGILLDKMLDAVALSRTSNIFIANMVKCRPPQNRDPQADEMEACLPFLREQVRLIRPRIIVCVGRISAQRLISPDFKVTKQHGAFFEKNGVLMMGTFHPAALLRNPNQKPMAFEDWLKLRDMIKKECPEVYDRSSTVGDGASPGAD
ncbi:MAG: uracil-DNA glycosylase family protein [Candidatus Fimivivens sp.]